jgi:RNA polymerase sigma-70 factor (ECF subfamily)
VPYKYQSSSTGSIVDDEDLAGALAAARAGNERGFAALWRAFQPAVLRYLRVVIGADPQDAASETWLQAARDIRNFRGDPAGFRVWLFRIARNRGLDQLRRDGRRREDLTGTPQEDTGYLPDAAAEAFDRMGTEWAVAQIAKLPPDQAEALMLRVVAGLDVAQAAQVLGKRPGAVRIAAMRGLRRLARSTEVQARWTGSATPTGMMITGGDPLQAEGV